MAFDAKLADRLRQLLAGNFDVHEKKMFGGLAFMCRGYLFVGIVGDELMARVGAVDYEAVLQLPNVRKMDFSGKPMTGYVFVAPSEFATDQLLENWMIRCLRFIDTLPPK